MKSIEIYDQHHSNNGIKADITLTQDHIDDINLKKGKDSYREFFDRCLMNDTFNNHSNKQIQSLYDPNLKYLFTLLVTIISSAKKTDSLIIKLPNIQDNLDMLSALIHLIESEVEVLPIRAICLDYHKLIL